MRRNCIVCGAPLQTKPLYVCKDMPAKSQDLPTDEMLIRISRSTSTCASVVVVDWFSLTVTRFLIIVIRQGPEKEVMFLLK